MIVVVSAYSRAYETNRTYDILTASYFFLTGFACIVVLSFLISMIRKTFTDELNQEMKRLVTSQSIFVATFILRVGLISLVFFGLWVDFTSDYPSQMPGVLRTSMLSL